MIGTTAAVSALFLYAVTTLLTRFATDRTQSDLGLMVVMLVTVLSAAILLVAAWIFGYAPSTIAWLPVTAFCAAGFFSAFLGRWLMFESVVRLGAARASAFQTVSPLFTALFGWILLSDQPTVSNVIAMLTTLAGLILVTHRGDSDPASASAENIHRGRSNLLLLGLASAAAYALGNICRAYAVRQWNEPLMGTFLGAATGLALQMTIGIKASHLVTRLKNADRSGLWLFAGIGVLGLAAQIFTVVAMRHLPVGEVALIMTATPLLVFPASWVLLRRSEAITVRAIIGLVIALCGIAYLLGKPL